MCPCELEWRSPDSAADSATSHKRTRDRLQPLRKSKQERRAAKRRKKHNHKIRTSRDASGRRFTLYCDESGNSGINYLDEGQPIYAVGGWLVPREREDAWLAAIDGIRLESGVDELHGKKLLKSRAGRDTALRVLEAGLQRGCLPVSLVAWKDHALALRLVETFLDPGTNPSANWLPNNATDTRSTVATLIHAHAWEAVKDFGLVFKEPDRSAWTKVAISTADRLAALEPAAKDCDLASRAAESLRAAARPDVIQEILGEEHMGVSGERKRGQLMALNYPMFLNLLRNTDRILERQKARCDVVHDATFEFEGALAEGVEIFKRVGKLETFVEDGTLARLSTASYDSFQTASSAAHPGLQAADVLVSSIGKVAKKQAQGRDVDPRERTLLGLGMGHEMSLFRTGALPRLPGVGSDDQIIGLHVLATEALKRYLDAKASGGE